VSVSAPSIEHGSNAGSDCSVALKLLHRVPSANNSPRQHLRLRCNNPRPLSDLGYHPACQLHELRKYQPLPAVTSDCWTDAVTSCQQTAKVTASIDSIDSGFITSDSPALSDKHMTVEELDVVLQMFDRSVVLAWLEQAKRSITDISDWCLEEDNFIHFAHFWLSEFPFDRRSSMFEFEYGLLRDKIASGCRSKQPSPEQLNSVLTVTLHEFPEGHLCGFADAYIFLEHLEALAERRKRDSLLSAVTYSLNNSRHHDCLLAVRSYALVSICSAILDQYRSGVDSVSKASRKKPARRSTAQVQTLRSSSRHLHPATSRPSTANSVSSMGQKPLEDEMTTNADISSQKRMFNAIRFTKCFSVLSYMLQMSTLQNWLVDAYSKCHNAEFLAI